jgi:hypothetical protein
MRLKSSNRRGIALLVVVLAAVCGCGGAFAKTTYRLELSGQAVHQLNCWEDPHFCDPNLPPPKDQVYAWTGYVDLAVASSGDGTFTDPDLLSVDFVANLAGFSVPGENPPASPERLWPFSGSVTILDGKVTSFNGSDYFDYFESPDLFIGFSGLSAHFTDPGGPHTGPTDAVGTLVMVPEPATWLLLLSGLPFLATLRGGSLRRGPRASASRTRP